MLKIRGGGRDLSSGLTPEVFGLEDLTRFGINGGVSVLAFDPVQSLLVTGTDSGRVYVFGQPGVQVEFDLCPGKPIIHLRIVKSIYLVTVDGNNTVTVISLETKDILSLFTPSSPITAIESDPSLDWLFLGLDNGLTIVYDVDRGAKTPYRIGNLQKHALPRSPISPVVFIAIHPRSFYILLIGYENCALVYSLAEEKILHVLQYEIPPGAPGGDLFSQRSYASRFPRVTTGVWHPNGHHILTAYEDGSFVFWDAKEGVLIQARTIEDTEVNHERSSHVAHGGSQSDLSTREPIFKVAWCCSNNPEDTALIIAGGQASSLPLKGMTFMDFGPLPAYQITTYQAMSEYYASPRRQRIYPVSTGADPVDFLMIPKSSPFYAGNKEPTALVAILSSGELYSIEYPSGAALPVAAMFPPSLCWIQPRVSALTVSAIRREQWIGMMASKRAIEPMLTGGAPLRKRLRRFDIRNIILTGHSDGYVRLWDASHGEIENSQVLDLSIADALDRSTDVRVSALSFSGPMGEISVACETGELLFFRFGLNRSSSPEEIEHRLRALTVRDEAGNPPIIQIIVGRTKSEMKEGFLPVFNFNPRRGPITALKNSDIGFLAVGYQFGSLAVVDLRSMSLIFLEDLANQGLEQSSRKLPSLRSSRTQSQGGVQIEIPSSIEFSLMALENDQFSSIVLSIGTDQGRLLNFRVVPTQSGSHAVKFISAVQLKGKVSAIIPFDTEYGVSAIASQQILLKLPQGIIINGAIIAVTAEEAKIFRLPKNKITSRSFDDKVINSGLSFLRQGDTLVLTTLTEAGFVKIYALPSLKEITALSVQNIYHLLYAPRSQIAVNGDILLGIGKNEVALLNIWGRGLSINNTVGENGKNKTDALFDVLKSMPLRPAISTLQWMSGVKYITPEDFDLLSKIQNDIILLYFFNVVVQVGGPNRPKSKRMVEEERSKKEQQRLAASQNLSSPSTTAASSFSSFFSGNKNPMGSSSRNSNSYSNSNTLPHNNSQSPYGNMSNVAQERGERLSFMQDQFSKLEDAASEYGKSISDFLDDQRKSAATGYFKSKFGL
ncbi:lethal giant larvae like, C-terminal-domain-containing protein [Lipomyces japonicus]|uniref:lethal giant larvae like, C-terminal-domain-containing protein n=1 Tax=Lipomyces japonicus TaxID=56871 RepID=UPI0034CFD632